MTAVPAPGADDGAAQRARILRAAQRLHAAGGSRSVTVEDVLAATGYNRRIFYRHFASKDDLALAMARRAGDQLRDGLERVAAEAPDERAAVVAYIDHFLGVGWDRARQRDGRVFLTHEMEMTAGLSATLEDIYDEHRAILRRLLKAARDRCGLAGIDPELDAFALHAVILRHLELRVRGRTSIGRARARAHLLRLVPGIAESPR